ncbi:MAG: hypothetical protein IT535_14215 [Bauldia sp.]|nr:hypothetical protein [Bauldia sp.]
MSKVDDYAATLRGIASWVPYLRKESNLPGPRGNLELAHAVARIGTRSRFEELLRTEPVGTNTPEEFLLFCGVLGLGKLVAEGEVGELPRLRSYASHGSWRVREAVATALQLVGDTDPSLLARTAASWTKGSWLEQRAAAAALAEPRLLKDAKAARKALAVLDGITAAMAEASAAERASADYKVLRQAMGYCWSVVVAALPEEGKAAMERWLASDDSDISWTMRENLKKSRLAKTDAAWVARWSKRLAK